MMMSGDSLVTKIDWLIVLFYLALTAAGLVNIYSSTQNIDFGNSWLSNPYHKQFIFVGLSFLIGIGVMLVKTRVYRSFSGLFYLIGVILLVGVLFFGREISGASSWYGIMGFSIQPSEFAKVTTALMLSAFLSRIQTNMNQLNHLLVAIGIVGLPMLLVLLQPDAGTVLVFLMLLIILFNEGLNILYLIVIAFMLMSFLATLKIGVLYTILSSVFLCLVIGIQIVRNKRRNRRQRRSIVLYALLCLLTVSLTSMATNYIYNDIFKSHHQNRFKLWLNLENSPQKMQYLRRDYGYNTYQAEKAISSGGLEGKGFLKGTRTRGHFIPEQHTDYIFSTIGEEWGFLGSSLTTLLFSMLIGRIIWKSAQQKNAFSRNFGYCVAIILFTHYIINIGMVIGLLPTVGIPLPFFSYGGSAFIGFSLLLFIFLKLDANKSNEWTTTISS